MDERTELVRKLNVQIREVGGRLLDQGDYSLDFYCECGCWETVRLNLVDYDALEGDPMYRAGHPVGGSEDSA